MKTFKARYIFPVAGKPIRDGILTLDGDRIASIGSHDDGEIGEIHDLGNVAIVPGFVNAHTHLNFSDLSKPIGEPGIDFVAWLHKVMAFRRELGVIAQNPIELGLQESLRHGTTTLGDIAQVGWTVGPNVAVSPSLFLFQEIIGPVPNRIPAAMEIAKKHCGEKNTSPFRWPGLSPHAPYSVHPELLTALVQLSTERRIPLAMHLAETAEEVQLLRDGDGPFCDFLKMLGAWNPAEQPCGRRPLDFLQQLAAAHRALIIHGGYLDSDEIEFLSQNAERMAVVYCPRTHVWFNRKPHSIEKMLAAGVSVALGTDGRGSSPDLSLLNEMRCVAQQHPTIPLSQILQLGTLGGAFALGQESCIGSLERGKQADLTIVGLPNHAAADPHELLFDNDASVTACLCRGRPAYVTNQLTIT
jgi:cytosine/adenosine deaminase-related metal-dependent hydrolase